MESEAQNHPSLQRLLDGAREKGIEGPAQLARALDVTDQVVTNWKRRGVARSAAIKAQTVIGLSSEWINSGLGAKWITNGVAAALPTSPTVTGAVSNVEDAPALGKSKGVPVVGEVQAGDDGYLEEMQYPVGFGDGVVEYWCKDQSAYALRVRGESMHPRYRHGEYIVVTPSIEAQPGQDVVVQLHDGRKMLKQLNWIRAGEVQLLSINNHFGPMTFRLDEVASIQRVAGSVGSDALVRA